MEVGKRAFRTLFQMIDTNKMNASYYCTQSH